MQCLEELLQVGDISFSLPTARLGCARYTAAMAYVQVPSIQQQPMMGFGMGSWRPEARGCCLCKKGFLPMKLRLRHPGSNKRGLQVVSAISVSAFSGLQAQLKQCLVSQECGRLLGTFIPVALAVGVAYKLKIGFEGEILVAIFRASIQLVALGFALKFVFEGEKVFMCSFAIFFMLLVAGHTAGERSWELPKSRLVATLSLALGAVGTLALMILLRVYEFKPRYIIPTAGYVVGNSMSMVGTTLARLQNDIHVHQGQIEVALALGATPAQAVQPCVRRAVTQGMGPIIDSLKTAGLVSMPGSMTGMLMGGSPPLEAVQMQIQVLYMLLGASALSCLFACFLGWRVLFSKSYQLIFDDRRILS